MDKSSGDTLYIIACGNKPIHMRGRVVRRPQFPLVNVKRTHMSPCVNFRSRPFACVKARLSPVGDVSISPPPSGKCTKAVYNLFSNGWDGVVDHWARNTCVNRIIASSLAFPGTGSSTRLAFCDDNLLIAGVVDEFSYYLPIRDSTQRFWGSQESRL